MHQLCSRIPLDAHGPTSAHPYPTISQLSFDLLQKPRHLIIRSYFHSAEAIALEIIRPEFVLGQPSFVFIRVSIVAPMRRTHDYEVLGWGFREGLANQRQHVAHIWIGEAQAHEEH